MKRARARRAFVERPGFSEAQCALVWLDEHLDELAADAPIEISAAGLRLALSRERTVTAAAIARRRKVDAIPLIDAALEGRAEALAGLEQGSLSGSRSPFRSRGGELSAPVEPRKRARRNLPIVR